MQFSTVAGTLALLMMCGASKAGDSAGCRHLPFDVRYEAQGVDDIYVNTPTTIRVIDVSPGGLGLSIAMYSPSMRRQWDWRLFEEYARSADGGLTWRDLGSIFSPLVTPDYKYVRAPSDPHVLYEKLDDGEYARSEDGGATWSIPDSRIDGLNDLDLFGKKPVPSRAYHADFTIVAIHPKRPLTVYAAIEILPWVNRVITSTGQFLHGVYVSNDGGETWRVFSTDLVALGPDFVHSVSLAISPSNSSIMYGMTLMGLSRTADAGKNWTLLNQQEAVVTAQAPKRSFATLADRTTHLPIQIQQIAIDPNNDLVVYLVSDKGVYRTLDGGGSWEMLSLGFDRWNGVVNIGIDPSNTNELFVGTKTGLLKSEDRGCHFVHVHSPVDDPPGFQGSQWAGPRLQRH
jgi:hypothetical protein